MENISVASSAAELPDVDRPPASCCLDYDADCHGMTRDQVKRCVIGWPFRGYCPMIAALPALPATLKLYNYFSPLFPSRKWRPALRTGDRSGGHDRRLIPSGGPPLP